MCFHREITNHNACAQIRIVRDLCDSGKYMDGRGGCIGRHMLICTCAFISMSPPNICDGDRAVAGSSTARSPVYKATLRFPCAPPRRRLSERWHHLSVVYYLYFTADGFLINFCSNCPLRRMQNSQSIKQDI